MGRDTLTTSSKPLTVDEAVDGFFWPDNTPVKTLDGPYCIFSTCDGRHARPDDLPEQNAGLIPIVYDPYTTFYHSPTCPAVWALEYERNKH